MTAVLLTPPYLQFFDSDGVTPLSGGKVYTYTSTGGTFATLKETYTSAAGSTPAANPVVLNSRGIPTSGDGGIWLSGTYDFKITDSDDVQVGQQLAVTAFTALAAASTAYFQSFSGTGAQTAFTTSTDLGTDEKAIYVWVDEGAGDAEGYQIQNPSAYTISGTTLTFSVAPASGTNNIYVSAPSSLVGAASSSAAAASASAAAAAASAAAAATAETNAETAETNAETAETNAETAQAAAEAAQAAAEAAQAAAETAETNAQTAETNAETAETNAETAQAAAEAAQAAAETAETNAETAETNAETAETNAETAATAAAASATSAAGSETGASMSNTALKYTYSTTTSMADPGSGNVRLNNATIGSVTQVAISAGTADSGNPDVSDFIVTWDDSDHAPAGTILIRKGGAPAVYAIYSVTGTITDNTTWLQIPVTFVSTSGTFTNADTLYFGYSRSGDDGSGVGTVTSIATTAPISGGTITNTGTISLDINAATGAAPATGDLLVFADVSASNLPKKATIADILALVSSGAYVLLSTQTASNSTAINFDSSLITSTYKNYIIIWDDVVPASDGSYLMVRVSEDNGSTVPATNGDYIYSGARAEGGGNTVTGFGSASAPAIRINNLGVGNDTGEGSCGHVMCYNPTGSGRYKRFGGIETFQYTDGVSYDTTFGGHYIKTTNALNYLRMLCNSGNITSGVFKLIGIL